LLIYFLPLEAGLNRFFYEAQKFSINITKLKFGLKIECYVFWSLNIPYIHF